MLVDVTVSVDGASVLVEVDDTSVEGLSDVPISALTFVFVSVVRGSVIVALVLSELSDR